MAKSRSDRMYGSSPTVGRNADDGTPEVQQRSAIPPEEAEADGTDGTPVHIRHGADRREMTHRHVAERLAMHHRHETEHDHHDHVGGGHKGAMHARHAMELHEMHGRHHAEMTAMHKRHESEHGGGEPKTGKAVAAISKE